MDNIFTYITQNPIGIALLAIISSIIGSLLYDLFRRYLNKSSDRIKRRKFTKRLVRIAESFGYGSRTMYASQKGSFHQALIVGDFIIKIVVIIGKILFVTLSSILLSLIFRDFVISIPLIIVVLSLVITILYKELRRAIKYYSMCYKYVFGEKYFESELDGQKEYWDSLYKKKDKKENNNPKVEFEAGSHNETK